MLAGGAASPVRGAPARLVDGGDATAPGETGAVRHAQAVPRSNPAGAADASLRAAPVAAAPAVHAHLAAGAGSVAAGRVAALRRALPVVVVGAAALGWAALFGWLALSRHLAGGSHAEDLGFTDQVLANFLRGQAFRMSIYQGATWNTEFNIAALARPDSLLAFHVEPMLVLLVPLYALGGGISWLLLLQSAAVAAGALPAFRLGRHLSDSAAVGLAVATAYLLSPLGQWAVLSDFHTSTLAAPLLLACLERLVVGRAPRQALALAALALLAREDVGPVVATIGVLLVLGGGVPRYLGAGIICLVAGLGCTACSAVVIHRYAGDGLSPLGGRYADLLANGPAGLLVRPDVLGYAGTLLLGGGWLAALAPLGWLPALPTLAFNVLSSSPWMASGRAHYSALVLPFATLAAATALGRLRHRPRLRQAASAALVLGSLITYAQTGAGPFGGNFAPAELTAHAARAASLAAGLPPDASVSASSALVPRLSRRSQVYVFPAVVDAEYIFVDLQASPAPTSAGDVFVRLRSLLQSGGWQVEHAEDGLLLLHREDQAPPVDAQALGIHLFGTSPTGRRSVASPQTTPGSPSLQPTSSGPPAVGSATDDCERVRSDAACQVRVGGDARPATSRGVGSNLTLLDARLVPPADGAIDVDGPRWVLRTTWRAEQRLPPGARLGFWLDLRDGQRLHVWDVAGLWWWPLEQWPVGQTVNVDVPNVPLREFISWQATLE